MEESQRILVIDQGNTLLKMFLFVNGSIEDRLVCQNNQSEKALAFAEKCQSRCGVFCSVATLDVQLVESLRHLLGDELLVLTHSTPLPIGVDYDVKSLGLDRIAAAVGVASLLPSREAFVVDAGTALTADNLSADGIFLGGAISPGLIMRSNALHAFTARLPKVEMPLTPSSVVGKSTVEAILSGALWGAALEIAGRFALTVSSPDAALVLTGGDATIIKKALEQIPSFSAEIFHVPDLVAEGLHNIYLHNRLIDSNRQGN